MNPKLMEHAVKVGGERTQSAAVPCALEECSAPRQQKQLLPLVDKLEWDVSFDCQVESQ